MTDAANAPSPRRVRRQDPDRKNRVIDATLEVIAERGVANTTHRVIAAAADVPLGSLTYYFTSLDDLLEQAFGRHARQLAARYEHHFDQVRTRADLVEALADLVHGGAGTSRDAVITFELYLAALRNPALRTVAQSWLDTSRTVLEHHVDSSVARGVDALVEGLIIHSLLSAGSSADRAETVEYIDRVLGVDLSLGSHRTHDWS